MTLICVVFHLIMFKPLEQLLGRHSQTFDNSINVVTSFIKCTVIGITIAMSISFKVRKSSLRNMLNKIDPSTQPWGTPKRTCSYALIFIIWFFWGRRFFISFKAFRINPCAFDFAIENSSSRQSKGFKRSVRRLTIVNFLFAFFLTSQTGSTMHYNPSKTPNYYFERNSSINKLTCLLTCMFFKHFSNNN